MQVAFSNCANMVSAWRPGVEILFGKSLHRQAAAPGGGPIENGIARGLSRPKISRYRGNRRTLTSSAPTLQRK